MRSFKFPVLVALFLLLTAGVPAQSPPEPTVGAEVRLLVVFRNHAFTLDAYREACSSGQPDAVVRPIVAKLERDSVDSRKPFIAALERLGGRVRHHYWIIDACAVSVPSGRQAAVAGLPNVDRIQVEEHFRTCILDATNVTHHASDQANTRTPANGGGQVRGNGLAVAVVDTGADGNMGGTGRPHQVYYTDGVVNPAGLRLRLSLDASGYGTEALLVHGLQTTACAASGGWSGPGQDRGIAPEADIVSIKADDPTGGLPGSAVLFAYQLIATHRAQHRIVAANCSFSGNPNPVDALQQALDSLAYNANVFVAVAAGNTGQSGTGTSPRAFNGVSAGSIDKYTLAWSPFSTVGPTYLNATYPDIAAVGAGMTLPVLDNQTVSATNGGTSYSSPIDAGAGALVLHAGGKNPNGFPVLTALEAKALLLNYTQVLSNSNRNYVGLGMLKCTTSVDAAVNGWVVRDTVSVATPKNFTFQLNANETRSVTVAWFRSDFANPNVDNLDLRVYDASNALVASGLTAANSYEKVTIIAPPAGGQYRAEVTAVALYGSAVREFALAGAVRRTPLVAPQITNITPTSVPVHGTPPVTLTGVGFAYATRVTCAGIDVTNLTITGDTQIVFVPPQPGAVGPQSVTVTNPLGTSNAVNLTYTAMNPPILLGSRYLASTQSYPYTVYGIPNGITALFMSGSNLPSSAPGVVDLGIGNGFSDLILIQMLGNNGIGLGAVNLRIPAGSSGLRFFLQGLGIDFPRNPVPPFPVTNVLDCTVVL